MAFLLRLCGLLRGCSGKAIVPAAACVLAAFAASAHAATCVEWSGDGGKSWQSSTSGACAVLKSTVYTAATTSVTEKSEGVCKIVDSGMYIRDEQLARRDNTNCDKCRDGVGQISTMNVTRGWARSALPNKADQLGATAAVPKRLCGGPNMCPYSVLGNEESYRSQTPSAQGLYRLSSDVTVIQVEGSCTPTDEAAAGNPSTPDKPCPGQLGELNGKPYCAVTPDATGVEPFGPPGKQTDDKGNPTAGPKPSSGEGSGTGGVGRTPTAGNGGNLGGPAGAAAGGTGAKPGAGAPNGTTDKPAEGKEQAACGAPGQPKCQIDETGTPEGNSAYEKADGRLDEIDAKRKEMLDGVKSTSDKDTSWGIVPSWLQHGSCAPWDLGTLPVGAGVPIQIDVCRIMPYVEAVMSFMWAAMTFIATLSMVFRVTTASKD